MSVNWNSLRVIGNSLNDAFEELCCQLAELVHPLDGKSFVRKGTPDAGVECYWQLRNDNEIGWQAKFFDRSLDDAQWNQLDSSFRTALDKHPKLVEFIVCLPRNLSDGRVRNTSSERDKWNSRVSLWEQAGAKDGRPIKITLWDKSAILKRLANPINRGLLWFFFETQVLTMDWFAKRARESLENAGTRYDRELHVENAEQPAFEAFVRSNAFWKEFGDIVNQLERVFASADGLERAGVLSTSTINATKELLHDLSQHLKLAALGVNSADNNLFDWNSALAASDRISRQLSHDFLDLVQSHQKGQQVHRTQELEHQYRNYHTAIARVHGFADSIIAKAANAKGLLIVGAAGQGKTHTSCRWTQRLIDDNIPVVLLFGEQFVHDEPWNQIIARLGLACDREQFIGALAAAGRLARHPVVLMLDGLNEGPGNHLWQRYLAGMVECLKNEPWIRLCLTVRDIYEDHVIPRIPGDALVRIEHAGFSRTPDLAASQFFEHYGISPSTPLLDPEFDNPLFLKLFCKGLQARGLTDIPRGVRGITAILDFFLESINKKLARQLGFDARDKLVHKAVELVAKEMSDKSTDRIALTRAKELINALHFVTTFENSLFRGLEAETILTMVPQPREGVDFDEEVRFVYQRFSDHLIARQMLNGEKERLLDASTRSKSRVSNFLIGKEARWDRFGLLQAFAIQLPETLGVEVFEISKDLCELPSVKDAVCDSLRWRGVHSFTEPLARFLEPLFRDPETITSLLDILISLAIVPNHPFNSVWLNKRLRSESMPQRDAWWSTFLYAQNDEVNSVTRLISWCWRINEEQSVDSELIELAGMSICWFFTTPHRGIRDRATKAAVNLFLGRIDEFLRVYDRFTDTDDPYLSERLHAVACGIGLRSINDDKLSILATRIYENVFADRIPPEHILIRDYARQVVEYAFHRGCHLPYDVESVRPPYGSKWIAESELERETKTSRYDEIGKYVDNDFNNFSQHICDFNEWSQYRIDQVKPWSPGRSMRDFEESLTDRQWKLLLETDDASAATSDYMISVMRGPAEAGREESLERDFQKAIQRFEASIRKGSQKWHFYVSEIQEYVRGRIRLHPPRHSIEAKPLRRWLLRRVRDLGWTTSLFREFDAHIRDDHDEINTEEGLTKKYVWIAVRELQSKLADNFELRDSVSIDSFVYDGPWRIIWGRDIDPTNTLIRTGKHWIYPHDVCWWAAAQIDDWHCNVSDQQWSEITTDLPDPKELIQVNDPETGKSWLSMEGYYRWMSPDPIGTDHLRSVQRKIYFILKGYLIRSNDVEKVAEWASKQRWMQRWMPENQSISIDIYSGEYFWSRVYKSVEADAPARSGWVDVDQGGKCRLPAQMLVASEDYHWEQSASDSSLEGGIGYTFPSKCVVSEMQLQRHRSQSRWYDSSGTLVAFDPSVDSPGPSALLIERSALEKYLVSNELTVFWTVLAERQLIGGGFDHDDYVGHVEANGSYILNNGEVNGEMRPKFIAKGKWTSPLA